MTGGTDPPSLGDQPTSSPPSPAARPGLRGRILRALGWLVILGAAVQPAGWILSRYSWTADLFCHFREPGLLASASAAGAAVLLRRKRLAIALGGLALLQAYGLTGYGGPNPVLPARGAGDARPLRVLMANILYTNQEFDDLVALVKRERPDVLALVEFTPECGAGLAAIDDDYPYRVEVPWGASGLALWLRERPLAIDPPLFPVAGRNPILHATFHFAGQVRHVWAVHPTSPLWRKFEPGNPELRAIAATIAAVDGSRIVIGDFNTTDASAHYREFVATTRLRDSRFGFGRQPSWPTMFFYQIPIDHAFVSDDLAVVDRRLGPMVGSDHFPVVLDLLPAAKSTEARSIARPTVRVQVSQSTGPR